jgi:2-phospho-L-lactate/phosphoenolpyruvate guanylyltransferase
VPTASSANRRATAYDATAYDPTMPDVSSPGPRIVAVIPVGALEGAKSRLGGTLDAEERRELAIEMLDRTIRAALTTSAIDETLVISPDREVLDRAASAGARTLLQRSQGLNSGLREARADAIAGGAGAIVILPIDLPLVSSAAVQGLIAPLEATVERPLVVLAPDRHGRGTNGLLVAPPDAVEFGFGGDSRAAHAACAAEAGARYIEIDGPLALDIDTPDDLLFVEHLLTETADAR